MGAQSDDIIDLYRQHAGAWMAQRRTGLFEKRWLDAFLGLLPARPAVLDVGCGFGEPIGRYLIEAGCRLDGVDAAPELIAVAQSRLPEATWRVADMRDLRPERPYNGILAWDSFFHLGPDDQRAMFAVFAQHAAPGAALMFTSGPRQGTATGALAGAPLYHASLDAFEYRALLQQHGFCVVDHVAEDPDCAGHTVWLVQRDKGA